MRELPDSLEELLCDVLEKHNIVEHYARIRPLARLTFLMRVSPVEDAISAPIGRSRFGGTPDLPPGVAWARNPEDDLLLDFIGQINLAELPDVHHPLPKSGLLLLYSQQDGACENAHSIQYVTAPTESLVRAAIPAEDEFSDEDSEEPYGSVQIVEFIPSVSLPDSPDSLLDLGDEFYDRYSEAVHELRKIPSQKEPASRLLGDPFSPYDSALPGEEWELLVEVESFFHQGSTYLNFWDAGCLQLLVKSADLPRCEFQESEANVTSM